MGGVSDLTPPLTLQAASATIHLVERKEPMNPDSAYISVPTTTVYRIFRRNKATNGAYVIQHDGAHRAYAETRDGAHQALQSYIARSGAPAPGNYLVQGQINAWTFEVKLPAPQPYIIEVV